MNINDTHIEHADLLARSHETDAEDVRNVREALQGESQAFERIMRRYNQRLYRLAVGVLGDPSEAQDVLQESYVRAYYLLSTYAGNSNICAWLARIVRNEAIDRLRARAARNKMITLEADLLSADDEDASLDDHASATSEQFDPETNVAHAHMKEILEHAIQSLPEQFRTVFVLREIEGLSIKEVAEFLDIPAATVKTRDHRARTLLRARLDTRIDSATKEAFSFMGAQCDAVVAIVQARIRQ